MKINNKGKTNYRNVISNPSNSVNTIEIPLQSSTNAQLEVLNNIIILIDHLPCINVHCWFLNFSVDIGTA